MIRLLQLYSPKIRESDKRYNEPAPYFGGWLVVLIHAVKVLLQQSFNTLSKRNMIRLREFRVFLQQSKGVLLGKLQGLRVSAQIRHMHFRQAALPGSEEVTGTPQTQVFFCDAKAVVGFAENIQTGANLVSFGVGNKNAPALMLPSADTTAQLMQLAKAEALFHLIQRRPSGRPFLLVSSSRGHRPPSALGKSWPTLRRAPPPT